MDSTEIRDLQDIYQGIEILARQRNEALERLRQAGEEINDLRRQLEATREQLHKTSLDAEYLKVSHKLAQNPQALAEARAMVRGMIGRVDKAIALLKEDARI